MAISKIPTTKITTTVRIDEGIYTQLQLAAQAEVRSVNNLIEYIILKYLEENHEG